MAGLHLLALGPCKAFPSPLWVSVFSSVRWWELLRSWISLDAFQPSDYIMPVASGWLLLDPRLLPVQGARPIGPGG